MLGTWTGLFGLSHHSDLRELERTQNKPKTPRAAAAFCERRVPAVNIMWHNSFPLPEHETKMLRVPSLPVSLSLALILLLFLSRRTAGCERELLTLGELVGKLFLPWCAVLRCVLTVVAV